MKLFFTENYANGSAFLAEKKGYITLETSSVVFKI